MVLGLFAQALPDLVLLEISAQDDLLGIQALEPPELIEFFLLKEYYLRVVVKCNAPSLGVHRDVVISLAMTEDPPDLVPAYSLWVYDISLVGHNSDRTVSNYPDSTVEKYNFVLLKVVDLPQRQKVKQDFSIESREERGLLKYFGDLESELLHIQETSLGVTVLLQDVRFFSWQARLEKADQADCILHVLVLEESVVSKREEDRPKHVVEYFLLLVLVVDFLDSLVVRLRSREVAQIFVTHCPEVVHYLLFFKRWSFFVEFN